MAPNAIDSVIYKSNRYTAAAPMAMVSTTWTTPPIKGRTPSFFSRSMENSRPRLNSSSAAPNPYDRAQRHGSAGNRR